MSPHSVHLHKRVPKPQLLDLGLPLSLPSPVANLLNPVVQIGPPSSSSSTSSNQPQKPNSPSPKPAPSPVPSAAPSPSSPPPSPSSSPSSSNGGNSQKGGNGGGSNGGNQSSGNGSNDTNGNQGNNNGGSGNGGSSGNDQGGDGDDNNGGQSNAAGGNGSPSQSGAAASTGNSNSQGSGGDQSQPLPNKPTSGGDSSSSTSGATSGAISLSSPSNATTNGNGGAVNFEPDPHSGAPILGDISSPSSAGDSTLQGGNAASGNNNPSKTGQPQPSTGSSSGDFPSNPSNGFHTVGNGANPLGGTTLSANSPATTNGSTSNGATGSKSHAGGIAAGIAVSLAALAFIAFILFFLRRRHQRKQADRRVTWITGFVDSQIPDMVERSSIRSSWGTPFERLTSWARTSNDDPFAYNTSENTLPVLPLPVHSPLDIGRPGSASPEIPENPFADVPTSAEGYLHPYQVHPTLPIRLSLISAGSGQDPFDDINRTAESTGNPNSGQTIFEQNANTTGHGPSQANFPLPPSTPASVKSGIAIGSPSDLNLPKELLATPSIAFSFPDSPISPTFASPDTASYHHRVSVKHDFRASQARSDEVHLEKGEEVSVVSVYEDGWAFVQKEKDNERGLVPLNCLDLKLDN